MTVPMVSPIRRTPHPVEFVSKKSAGMEEPLAALRLHEFSASTVEEIQTEGDLPPLFCMPAADGLTLFTMNCLTALPINRYG